ncbi:unnamed protein product [Owenia fusiformis]|uniref:PH domain-containing protein n=1 Tax=Owenia fusiformis TaxID=6347 RepID=A0A8S4PCB7_OWEFU|nr:unnamed protein product [Owenia fusiformis]
MMMPDGVMIDGSWDLTVTVTDLQVTGQIEKILRVKGDLHVGGVMLKLVESLDVPLDWSDHGLWWPDKNMWLSRTRSTLDQYGVQADANLFFTPMHKNLHIQLPDLQVMDMRVDFSVNVFGSVVQICKELGIRRPEELSLMRKLDKDDLKRNRGATVARRRRMRDSVAGNSNGNLTPNTSMDGNMTIGGSPYNRTPRTPGTPQGTLLRTPGTPGSPYGTLNPHSPYQWNGGGTMSPGSMNSLSFEGAMDSSLANSPNTPTKEALTLLYRPKSNSEKARINAGWLDSSVSLMEQGVRENDLILLRFKFYNFYDLNPKYDAVRINQIYEQAKWGLISEEIDCTEEEMMMFASLQLQVNLQVSEPQDLVDGTANQSADDDIDAALMDLQVSLEGSTITSPGDITNIPELHDYLKHFKPKKFTLKAYKKYWFTFKDTHVSMYRSKEDANPMTRINLKGCEVSPDVNIASAKYGIKLFVPSPDGLTENWIRCENEDQYAKWMAACKLASKGKTMADSSYDAEVKSILAFLSMQHPSHGPSINPNTVDIQPEDFVAPRFLKKIKNKVISQRILEAHANVRDMNLIEAKMNYIKAWQALPEYGVTYFIVKFRGSKKEELLGVASNRIMRMDLNSGDANKTWRYNTMEEWYVNWEIKQVMVKFKDQNTGHQENIAMSCLTADCKIVHEFLGGYIFLSMRSGDKNQTLDEKLFHKLTGGWD